MTRFVDEEGDFKKKPDSGKKVSEKPNFCWHLQKECEALAASEAKVKELETIIKVHNEVFPKTENIIFNLRRKLAEKDKEIAALKKENEQRVRIAQKTASDIADSFHKGVADGKEQALSELREEIEKEYNSPRFTDYNKALKWVLDLIDSRRTI